MKLLTNNPQLKLISLLIACLLWLSVTTNVRTTELLVPFEVQGVPPNRVLISSFSEKVKVRVSGPSFIVNSVEETYPVFIVKIPPGLQQDRYIAKFLAEDLMLPSSVRVLSIEPKQLDLLFDNRIRKEVPVEVPRIGNLNPDYSITSISVEPSRVILEGPSAQLKGIEQVETYPLHLDEIMGSTSELLGLRLSSNLVEASSPSVTARVVLQPVMVTETIENIPLEVVGASGRAVEFEPSNVKVRVSGTREQIRNLIEQTQSLQSATIKALIEVPAQSLGELELIPKVEISDALQQSSSITILGTEPSRIRLNIVG